MFRNPKHATRRMAKTYFTVMNFVVLGLGFMLIVALSAILPVFPAWQAMILVGLVALGVLPLAKYMTSAGRIEQDSPEIEMANSVFGWSKTMGMHHTYERWGQRLNKKKTLAPEDRMYSR